MKLIFNIIGRLCLIAAGVLICINGIPVAIDAVKTLNAGNGWWHFEDPTYRDLMITLGLQALNGLGVLAALVAVLRGRRGPILIAVAAALLVYPIYFIVTGVQAGTINGDWQTIWALILRFLVPILYFVGVLFLVNINKD